MVYRYHGREITTRLPYKPGRTIQVGVSLNVIDDGNVPPRNADGRDFRRDRGDRRDYRREGRGDDYRD